MADPVAKIKALAAKAEQRRQENRERYPGIAKFYDECKAVFGDVKIVEITPK